ncbi:membrane protein [Planobispora siamensis]|uniref:Membrane protein n=1 Tax=Planobispora siamensis TaxID=936338 RepID=A0A8J3SCZ2_9ACTN|nr:membrane protein [Planobispora siamensis]
MVAALLAIPAMTAAFFLLEFTGTPGPRTGSTGHDAMWLGHAWVDGRKTEADVKAMAVRLRGTGIRDVYVHAGPFEFSGRLRPEKYPNARDFLKWWKAELPQVRVSAWLGQKVDHGLDLGDPASRRRVLDGVRDIMAAGFDGVHYNFEPITSGDPGFLDLLDRTRPLVGDGPLSSSTPQIEPLPFMRPAARLAAGHDKYWLRDYFREVVARTDQVAIMTYDSFLPLGSLYGGHVVRQATLALDTVPEDKTLLVGAPAYHDHGVPWRDASESVAVAAEGARLALGGHGSPRERFGLALYVDFAATEEDWAEYHRFWNRPGSPPPPSALPSAVSGGDSYTERAPYGSASEIGTVDWKGILLPRPSI